VDTVDRARLGGQARAKSLSPKERIAIAAAGGRARGQALSAGRRRAIAQKGGVALQEGRRHMALVEDNFRRLEMIRQLRQGVIS
jgi:hypothetical protein